VLFSGFVNNPPNACTVSSAPGIGVKLIRSDLAFTPVLNECARSASFTDAAAARRLIARRDISARPLTVGDDLSSSASAVVSLIGPPPPVGDLTYTTFFVSVTLADGTGGESGFWFQKAHAPGVPPSFQLANRGPAAVKITNYGFKDNDDLRSLEDLNWPYLPPPGWTGSVFQAPSQPIIGTILDANGGTHSSIVAPVN
jgi:hypothetical protein